MHFGATSFTCHTCSKCPKRKRLKRIWSSSVIPLWGRFTKHTLLHAAKRKNVLAHKVIFGCLVIVFNHEAHHGQFRSVNGEAQGVVPHWVKPCRESKPHAMLLINKNVPMWGTKTSLCTIIFNISGLLFGLVNRNAMDLHPDQRIHYRIFFYVDLG